MSKNLILIGVRKKSPEKTFCKRLGLELGLGLGFVGGEIFRRDFFLEPF